MTARTLHATHRGLALLIASALGCGGIANGDLVDAGDSSAGDDSALASDGDVLDEGQPFGDSDIPAAHYLQCPTVEPAPSSACDDRDNLCEYGSGNNVLCNTLYGCNQQRWYVAQDAKRCPVVESCPADLDAGTCSSSYTRCEYPDAGRDCVCSSCGAGPPGPHNLDPQWRCFDPGAGCPLARPNMGTACAIANGGRCTYSAGGCCTGVMLSCEDGVWTGYVTEPCP